MKKSAFISDILFTFFSVSVFTLCLFRHYKISLPLAVFLSAVCGILAASGIAAFLQSKRKNFFLKKSDEAQKQKLLLHLALLSDERKTQFFLPILSEENAPAKRFGKLRIHTPDAFYDIKIGFSAVTAEEIANFFRLRSNKNKILLCAQIEENAALLCKQLNIQVKNANDVYALVKEHNAFPDVFLGEKNETERRKFRFRLCFAKTNGKRFLTSGILILLTSLLTPFSYYYLLFGSVLLLAALFIRIFGYE